MILAESMIIVIIAIVVCEGREKLFNKAEVELAPYHGVHAF
jgi:hypothetical protein